MAIPAKQTVQVAARCSAEPTVLNGVRTDLCAELEKIVLARMHAARRSIPSLNVGGWKSAEDVFAWPDEAVQELRRTIVAEIGADPIAWAMVNRAGSYHPRHQHTIARLVGVYYVTPGDPATPTIFECGRDAKSGALREVQVSPQPGRLVLCPGTMWHRVPRYDGEAPRITIAFDVRR